MVIEELELLGDDERDGSVCEAFHWAWRISLCLIMD